MATKQFVLGFFLLGAIALSGCRGKHQRAVVQNEEPSDTPPPRAASVLRVTDPAAQEQLLHGFYGVEGGAWRWTAGKFTVALRPPLASAQRGATLSFAFSVPDVVIRKLHDLTLTAWVGSAKLKSETYTNAGSYTFTTDVPPELLAKDPFIVDFALDKSLPPGPSDRRELGVIAVSVGLEGK
ncbi:MAG: hypothetical protein ABSB15_07405 [Bryobacteraceae bacterium]